MYFELCNLICQLVGNILQPYLSCKTRQLHSEICSITYAAVIKLRSSSRVLQLKYRFCMFASFAALQAQQFARFANLCCLSSMEPLPTPSEIVLPPLAERRQDTDLKETYKYLTNRYITPPETYFTSAKLRLRGHSRKLQKNYSKGEVRKNFWGLSRGGPGARSADLK